MRTFKVDDAAKSDLVAAVSWYEEQRAGLGEELLAELERVLRHVSDARQFVAAPILVLAGAVVRRERTRRFPYAVYFVETDAVRRVIAVLHCRRDPGTWRRRV